MATQKKKPERVRSVSLLPIPDWGHADDYVKRIGTLQAQIAEAELEADVKIAAIKADLQEDTREKFESIDLNLRSLEAFAEKHPDDFGKARSKKLAFGTLGWRKGTSIKIAPEKTLELLMKFPVHIRKLCIRIKQEVNKDGLSTLTDEQLATLKARREETDVFFVEPFIVEAVEHKK